MKDWGNEAFNADVTGLSDPHEEVRGYQLSGECALVGLLDNPWYPPYLADTPHTHNCMEIGVCLSGEGIIHISKRAWPFGSGTIIVVPRDVEHAQDNRGIPMTHWRYVLVNEEQYLRQVAGRYRVEAVRALQNIPGGVYVGDETASAEIMKTVEMMFGRFEQCGLYDDLELDALLRLLMAQISRAPGERPEAPERMPRTRQAIEPSLKFVSEHYPAAIRVEDMAACCAMSESYFRKVFARIMGMPPMEYVNSYRVNRAIYLLYSTAEPVAIVAEKCGFPSIATFNRNFKRFVGASPAQWRKNAHV